MICYIYQKKRLVNGKKKSERVWRARIRLNDQGPKLDFSLGVSEERAARKKLAEKREELELEAAGISLPKGQVQAARKGLSFHLNDYLEDLTARGRSKKYVYIAKKRLLTLFSQCSWKVLKDATPDSFTKWRARNDGKATTTLNQYLATASAFSSTFCTMVRSIPRH